MALNATIHNFEIELAHVDREVYETLRFRAARHPSESEEGFVVRVLAYALEYAEGIAFSNGIAEPEEPPVSVRDLTGAVRVWVDIGAPSAARLHKAAKGAARVVVYTHKDPEKLLRQWTGERIHRADQVEIYSLPAAFVDALVARLERRTVFALSVSGGHLYVTVGGESFEAALERHALATAVR